MGTRELGNTLLVHLFVYFARLDSLPLGVGDWLWLVILVLPEMFYQHLFSIMVIVCPRVCLSSTFCLLWLG